MPEKTAVGETCAVSLDKYWFARAVSSEKGDLRTADNGINGVIEDGSQRSFFPSGLAFYSYARTLFDTSLSYEEISEDYLSHIYGEDWQKFYGYLDEIRETFDFAYVEGERSIDERKTAYYDPERVARLEKVKTILKDGGELINSHYNSDVRVQTVAVRLLEMHAEYLLLIADAFIKKALGEDEEAKALFKAAADEIGKREIEFEPFYDHTLAFYSWGPIARSKQKEEEPIIALGN